VIRGFVGPNTVAVVLDAQTAPFIDVTATDMLTQLAHDLGRDHVQLGLAHPIGQTRDVLRGAATESNTIIVVYPTIGQAVHDLTAPRPQP
jgi:sulfate permease, SulP family